MKGLVNDMKKVGMKSGSMMNVTNEGIRERKREWYTREWKQGMNEKYSLKIYRKWRKEIRGQDRIYNNRKAPEIF